MSVTGGSQSLLNHATAQDQPREVAGYLMKDKRASLDSQLSELTLLVSSHVTTGCQGVSKPVHCLLSMHNTRLG